MRKDKHWYHRMGQEAARADVPPSQCPFLTGSWQNIWWQRGWNHAASAEYRSRSVIRRLNVQQDKAN